MTYKKFIATLLIFCGYFSYGMQEGWERSERKVSFDDISPPRISSALPAARIVRHASKGAIRGERLSYVSLKNYVAKANGAFIDVPSSVCCMTRCSGAKDSLPHTQEDIKAIPEAARGPRLHSEIAFLQDLTGVCDPARQEPSLDSVFATICKSIHDSLSEKDEGFDLEILIKNSRLPPCSRSAFTDDLGMDCYQYLELFCERVNNCDWFQQMTKGVCRIIVHIPGQAPVYIPSPK